MCSVRQESYERLNNIVCQPLFVVCYHHGSKINFLHGGMMATSQEYERLVKRVKMDLAKSKNKPRPWKPKPRMIDDIVKDVSLQLFLMGGSSVFGFILGKIVSH